MHAVPVVPEEGVRFSRPGVTDCPESPLCTGSQIPGSGRARQCFEQLSHLSSPEVKILRLLETG